MKNEIKTILFASLIAAMILPFSGMNYATAEETTAIPKELLDIIPSHLDEKKYYIIEQMGDELLDLSDKEKKEFFDKMSYYLQNRNADQIEFDVEAEKLSYIILEDKVNGVYDIDNPSEKAQKQIDVIMNLEGVQLAEKWDEMYGDLEESKAYPAEIFGIDLYAEEHSQNPFRVDGQPITAIPDNVRLGHEIRISYPAMNISGLPINIVVGWIDNHVTDYPEYLNTDAISPRIDNVGGDFHFSNHGCLKDNGNMNNNVTFDLYSGKIITAASGYTLYSDTEIKNDAKLYFNQVNHCVFMTDTVSYSNPTSVLGYHAYHSSSLYDVVVD